VTSVRLDHDALMRVLNTPEIARKVEDMAERVADNVRALGITVGDVDGGASEYDLPVTVNSYKSDRPRSSVTLAHPAGLAVQAKHGALSKAAADEGLEVNG